MQHHCVHAIDLLQSMPVLKKLNLGILCNYCDCRQNSETVGFSHCIGYLYPRYHQINAYSCMVAMASAKQIANGTKTPPAMSVAVMIDHNEPATAGPIPLTADASM